MDAGPVMFCPSAADSPLGHLSDIPGSPRRSGKTGPEYLIWVRDFVSTYKHKNLKNPAGATLTIVDLVDTMYSGKNDAHVVNGWGKFYLQKEVRMQVFGRVEGLSCPCDQLVLMTCEDKKIYGYDGEELHEVASTMEQLFEEGMTYPAKTSYYKGEAFKKMTENDWAKVKRSPVGKTLDEAHNKLVTAKKARFLENLKSTRQHTGVNC